MPNWLQAVANYLWENWEPVLAYLSALGAVVAYFQSRRREAAWKRTEFLFSLGQALDQDALLQEALIILEGRNPKINLDAVFDPNSGLDSQDRGKYQQAFDRLLNFLERLNHAVVVTKTLSLKEVDNFSWYLDRIRTNTRLAQYCRENGFEAVLDLGRRLDEVEH